MMRRRDFIKGSALGAGGLASLGGGWPAVTGTSMSRQGPLPSIPAPKNRLPNLEPARWVWYPSERCLQNTFVLFRRQLELPDRPRRAAGWIVADGRYLLEVNGQRVQWGPAPSDPRWMEVDPMELTAALRSGANTIGAQVLYYGQGDGT